MLAYLFLILNKLVSIFGVLFVLSLVLTHFLSVFKRPKPLKLNSDSVVVILGGCMGIGKLMALEIARLYHSTIVLVDFKKELFQQVSKQIKEQKSYVECIYCDLSDLKSLDKLISQIKAQWKHIDLLLYNAGILKPQYSWEDENDRNLNAVMNVNFFAPIKIIRELLDVLEGGHIAVVASVVSIIDGAPELSSYVASKHAIYGYLHSLRMQLKRQKKNITISVGCPYAINTTMFTGYKTKFEKILPILDQQYVAERLVKQFVLRKQVCFIGRKHAVLVKIFMFFPTFLTDWIALDNNISDFSELKKRMGKEKKK